MKSLLTNRKAGVYVLIVSILLQLVSAVNYLAWAPGAGGIDTLVALGLGLGCLAGIAAFLFSSDLLLVADTALCSCGMLQLAVSSAGSFADWYQGIVMFGDPSQVPRILTICILALTAVVQAVWALGSRRHNEENRLRFFREAQPGIAFRVFSKPVSLLPV